MLIKQIEDIEPSIKNKRLSLKEIIHPKNDELIADLSVSFSEIHDYTNPRKSQAEEICIVLEGEGKLYVGPHAMEIKKNTVIYIAPGELYRLENRGSKQSLKCMHITYPSWKPELEEEIKL